MANEVRFLGIFTVTSSGSLLTNELSLLNDAADITIMITSSVATAASTFNLQVNCYDDVLRGQNVVASSVFYTVSQPLSTPVAIAPGQAYSVSAAAWQRMRILTSGGETSGTVVGFATKMINV